MTNPVRFSSFALWRKIGWKEMLVLLRHESVMPSGVLEWVGVSMVLVTCSHCAPSCDFFSITQAYSLFETRSYHGSGAVEGEGQGGRACPSSSLKEGI